MVGRGASHMMVTRLCGQCGAPVSVSQRRLDLGHGRFCSKACQRAAQTARVPRVCEHCGASFAAHRYLVEKGYGHYCSRRCAAAAAMPTGRRIAAPRDGDRQQARRSVQTAIQRGERPHPDALPCTDCGHTWQPGQPHRQYDHYLGYSSAHHQDVEAVCIRCRYDRAIRRGEFGPHFRPRRPAQAFECWLREGA